MPTLKAELRQIKEQLEAIEISLESQLFSWGSLNLFGKLSALEDWGCRLDTEVLHRVIC